MKIMKSLILVTLLSFIISCTTPQAYLNKAVDIIQTNSINKHSIDWVRFRKDVLEKAKDAKNIKETYPAIRFALSQLSDNHSHFLTPEQVKNRTDQNKPLPNVPVELINNRIAYIKIPSFNGNHKLADSFAQLIQDKIEELDKNKIDSWVIDLSENTGGNMWPMLLGLGPILGDGVLGYFVSSENKYTEWNYFKGSVFIGKDKIMKLNKPYKLRNHIKKLAVIISHKTASSGEAIAVAFIGAKDVKFFGESTYGVSTGNAGHKLSDGAMIILTECKFADRNKKIYGVPITPDIADFDWTTKKTAVEWMNNK
jgi:carboxyl-terminal processing protease